MVRPEALAPCLRLSVLVLSFCLTSHAADQQVLRKQAVPRPLQSKYAVAGHGLAFLNLQAGLYQQTRSKQTCGRRPAAALSGLKMEADDDDTDDVMTMMNNIDKGPRKEDKVKVFGASLDSKIASRGNGLQDYEDEQASAALMQKALATSLGDVDKAKKLLKKNMGRLKQAEDIFKIGVDCMKAGRYQQAMDQFLEAIATTPDGALSREGGQYTLWLAQAMDAKGERTRAIKTIKMVKAHEDRDVRRVASGLEAIYTAPKLDLGEEWFQWIELDKLENLRESDKRMYAKMEKQPEKYTLEWYMLQKPPKEKAAQEGQDAKLALVTVAVVGGLFALYGHF